VLHRLLIGLLARSPADVPRGEGDVLQHAQVREQVELLEDHADLAANFLDVAEVVGELDPVHDDAAAVVLLEPVDAADHGRLPRARRAADHDDLLPVDAEIDVLERLEVPEPLRDAFELDHGLAVLGAHRSPSPSRRSSRWLSRDIQYDPVQ
jgi:hypothetical protein